MSYGVHMTHCFQGEYEDTCKYGDDDCPARVLEKKTKYVEVSQSALESLQKMVEQLQGERDDAVKTIFAIKSLYSGGQFDLTDSPKSFMFHVKRLCDECTAKPEVLE